MVEFLIINIINIPRFHKIPHEWGCGQTWTNEAMCEAASKWGDKQMRQQARWEWATNENKAHPYTPLLASVLHHHPILGGMSIGLCSTFTRLQRVLGSINVGFICHVCHSPFLCILLWLLWFIIIYSCGYLFHTCEDYNVVCNHTCYRSSVHGYRYSLGNPYPSMLGLNYWTSQLYCPWL